VVRDTIHDVACWHRRQRRLYAEHCQRVQDQARDQRGPIHVPAERVRPEPAGYLEAPRPAPMVIEGGAGVMSTLHDPVAGQLDILVELGVARPRRNVGVRQRRGVALPAGARYRWPGRRSSATRSGAIRRHRPRAEAVELYRAYLAERPELLAAAHAELTGHDLACYCPLDVRATGTCCWSTSSGPDERGAPREAAGRGGCRAHPGQLCQQTN
jgi:hypothetical protein